MEKSRSGKIPSPRELPRFFLPPAWIQQDWVSLKADSLRQIRNVLRLASGDWICVLDNTGSAYVCQIIEEGKGEWKARIEASVALKTEAGVGITVIQSLLRAEKSELVIRQCTQAGVSHIIFAPTHRSFIRWEEQKISEREERWQKIAKEEAELACRAVYPTVRIFHSYEEALHSSEFPRLLLYEGENLPLLASVIGELKYPPSLSILVGPEGGFTKQEVEQMCGKGILLVSLGPRILRSEFAAFYALAQILSLYRSPVNPGHREF